MNNIDEKKTTIILGGLPMSIFDIEKSLVKMVKKVAKFDYEKEKKSSMLDGLTYLCGEIKRLENLNQPQLLSLLTQLQQYLKYHIDHRPSDDDRNFLLFKRAISEVEEVLLLFRYRDKVAKKKIKTQYDLLTSFIFEEKNLSYVEYIFNHFPYTVNLENGKSLFECVVEAYTVDIKKKRQNETINQQVIELMLKRPELYVKEEVRNHLAMILTEAKYYGRREDLLTLKKIFLLFKQNKTHVSFKQTASEYQINVSFPSRILSLADQYDPCRKEKRKSTRIRFSEPLITIDKAGTVQFDDALSCRKLDNGNYLLGIHIADVTGIVPFSSLIIQEAINRVSTIYLPNQKMIHMLPPRIGMEYCALKAKEDHLANSYLFELSPMGEIVQNTFLKSIIKVDENMTDEQVNEVLCQQNIEHPCYETLLSLYETVGILSKIYPIGKVYQFIKDTEPDYTNLKMDDHTIAGKIVMSSMLLANHQIATYFDSNQFPLLRRVNHLSIEQDRLIGLLKKASLEKSAMFNPFLEEAFSAYYSSSYSLKGRHDGLNLDHYCHATSPIRRGSDLVVEECINRCYHQVPSQDDLYQLEDMINEKARLLNEGQQNINDFVKTYQLKLRQQLPGNK